MTRFAILLRHGTTGADDCRKFIGHTDHPLDADGEKQCHRLRRALVRWPVGRAYCSDLIRCRQTAEITIGDRDIEIIARQDLREPSMGEWEGRFRTEVAATNPEESAARRRDLANHKTKGGESFAEGQNRIWLAFQDIVATSDDNILIAGHGSANRLLLCQLLGMPIDHLFRLGQDHGCMNVIQIDETGYRLMQLNHVP
ncbi:histidine phosphatase family protein [Telmatospirillum sp.]|uniref:histidine phosphatase family protein n=1 Tax=Telmatospirillum sp. TaxID=2079197 RepID=UPI002846FD35|nr:histidine phosphatase family protein [Telmatospirillum sp.]MDR3439972.1 histidine phosphatase family protein [Telmatospirillum sp.]